MLTSLTFPGLKMVDRIHFRGARLWLAYCYATSPRDADCSIKKTNEAFIFCALQLKPLFTHLQYSIYTHHNFGFFTFSFMILEILNLRAHRESDIPAIAKDRAGSQSLDGPAVTAWGLLNLNLVQLIRNSCSLRESWILGRFRLRQCSRFDGPMDYLRTFWRQKFKLANLRP